MNTKALVAELVGTFALIFIGAGAGALGQGGLVGVALAHGLVVLAFAYAFGEISGTHINPAVTFGMLVAGRIKINDAVGYWAAQFVGGILGAAALSFVLGANAGSLGATVLGSGVTQAQGVAAEAILTFLFLTVIFQAGRAGSFAGVAIGMALAFCILMGGPLTGASLNPARTLGPALVSGNMADLWIYFVGPLVGAAGAAGLRVGVLKD